MVILGINESHGASACLNIDGRMVAAAQEERFSHLKNDEGYPYHSIEYCLLESGLRPEEIDIVAMACEYLEPMSIAIRRIGNFTVDDWIREQELYWKPKLLENKSPDYRRLFQYKVDYEKHPFYYDSSSLITDNDWLDRKSFLDLRKQQLKKHLGVRDEQIRVVKHFRAHSYYGFYAALVERKPTLVFHVESGGDGKNASVMKFDPQSGLQPVHLTDRCYLGRIYKYVTLLLGMLPAHHEYKVMGLAPYAKEQYLQKSLQVFRAAMQVDGLDFKLSEELRDSFWYFEDHLRGHRFDAIAGALQRFAEEILTEWIDGAIQQTGIRQVVLSGGVSMNVKANKRIGELASVESLFVAPCGSDDSLSFGAVYKILEERWQRKEIILDAIQPLNDVYLGPELSDGDIKEAIEEAALGDTCIVIDAVGAGEVARHLAQGKVIGRMKGRMEFGARALGNRSIIADPSHPGIVKKINDQIKQRDFWMPFCPTILADKAQEYVSNPKALSAPFMTIAFDSLPGKRTELAGAVHPADFTVRPQLLERERNPEYYDLISEFEKLSGIPSLLNTSMNLHGSPIDCSAKDGVKTFLNSKLDGLLLNDTLILRKSED